jgi:hypothetical protein
MAFHDLLGLTHVFYHLGGSDKPAGQYSYNYRNKTEHYKENNKGDNQVYLLDGARRNKNYHKTNK